MRAEAENPPNDYAWIIEVFRHGNVSVFCLEVSTRFHFANIVTFRTALRLHPESAQALIDIFAFIEGSHRSLVINAIKEIVTTTRERTGKCDCHR